MKETCLYANDKVVACGVNHPPSGRAIREDAYFRSNDSTPFDCFLCDTSPRCNLNGPLTTEECFEYELKLEENSQESVKRLKWQIH
jgi:hypothetical protein